MQESQENRDRRKICVKENERYPYREEWVTVKPAGTYKNYSLTLQISGAMTPQGSRCSISPVVVFGMVSNKSGDIQRVSPRYLLQSQ